ncbi:alpha/beta hydrolase [Mycolicibacterium smegmatis]|uniref:alpha/beta fold hydrolase n=1 Tax=Mycolicibacterium smegmatis TaxID=1772 RepID=UPI001E4A035A|nr:alpha/beta fold hydrolase [Mycolicibacterium smegmatis]UGT73093.1 alpha/beta hydrolase [Mycolicibacterium smegmatis]
MTSDVTLVHDSAYFDDLKMHYVRAGAGEPVVLLHGWPQTWYAWRKVIPLLAGEFEVIVPDLRGCGDTSKPSGGYDKKTVAHDVRRLVETLGHSAVHVVGHDIGAAVAYAYAAQWPSEVQTMTFIESSLSGFGQEELMDVANGGSWHFGFNMAGDISEDLVRGRERLLIEYWMRRTTVGVVDPTFRRTRRTRRVRASHGAAGWAARLVRALSGDSSGQGGQPRTGAHKTGDARARGRRRTRAGRPQHRDHEEGC